MVPRTEAILLSFANTTEEMLARWIQAGAAVVGALIVVTVGQGIVRPESSALAQQQTATPRVPFRVPSENLLKDTTYRASALRG